MSKSITFHLKSSKQGNCPVYIYGSIPELGGGDPSRGIEMSNISDVYSLFAEIKTDSLEDDQNLWYSYYFKTRFGAIVSEACSKRNVIINFLSSCFFDTFDMPSSIGGVVVRFRVKHHTNYGQQIYICGDSVELGKWQPEDAVPLEYSGEGDCWVGTIKIPTSDEPRSLKYKYIVFTSPRNFFWESQDNHCFEIGPAPSPTIFEVNDIFHWGDSLFEVYSRDPFIKVINRRQTAKNPLVFTSNSASNTARINFTVNAPYVRPNQTLCIIGSTPEIGQWETKKAVLMNDNEFPKWKSTIVFNNASFPIEYKYALINKQTNEILYESGYNRIIPNCVFEAVDRSFPISIIVNDWYTNPNTVLWKGFGISATLYSLKSEKSCGIGQYTDLINLIDYCNKIGSSLIHLLPINDTISGNNSWEDSNPFNIISGHALHPIYIDLLAIQGLPHELIEEIISKKVEFERSPTIDYPNVCAFKIEKLHEIYDCVQSSLETNNQFQNFVKENIDWLRNYGTFCYFRDKYKTKNFRKWPKHSSVSKRELKLLSNEHSREIQFYFWTQFICHVQFSSVRDYATYNYVVLEGEVMLHSPFESVSVWSDPELYDDEIFTGVLPTEENLFSCHMESTPSIDWKKIAASGYELWKNRISRMATFFHSIQLDQTNSIFRFWEANRKQCVRSLLGHFNPALPFSRAELKENGLFDIDRYVKPYVRWHILKEKFGEKDAEYIAEAFFNHIGSSLENQIFNFKTEFNTEKKIAKYLKAQVLNNTIDSKKKEIWEQGLMELIDNVLLVESPSKPDHYHVRAQVCIEKVVFEQQRKRVISSSSWSELPKTQKDVFTSLFTDYMYHRQNELWSELSLPKILAIKSSSNVLLCSDNIDANNFLPDKLYNFNILSNRIQRIPRYFDLPFDKVREYPYLSRATPATDLMPSVREWWEENSEVTADFWKREVWRTEEPPTCCETWIQELILKQHLMSQSMWTVFTIQDILSVDERYRPTNPKDERMSPSDTLSSASSLAASKYSLTSTKSTFSTENNEVQKWNKRMLFTLEDINSADDFCYRIRRMVEESHRI